MRKMFLTPLIVCIAALLFVLLTPAVYATTPATASGAWTYVPTFTQRVAGGNTFRYGEEVSTWTGTFDGTSNDVFTAVIHPSGHVTVTGLIDFTGIVNGAEGTLVIRFVGTRVLPGPWSGQWVILSGSGDLANLHGQGTWWGPPTDVDYSGQIHFDP